jgi:hypothetical protein
MAVFECSVTCLDCSRHDDEPCVLVAESVDHQLVGDDHAERMGGCYKVALRHQADYPGHALSVAHETPAEVTARVEAAELRREQIRARFPVIDHAESIARRRLRLDRG